jgi:hypothetical protein
MASRSCRHAIRTTTPGIVTRSDSRLMVILAALAALVALEGCTPVGVSASGWNRTARECREAEDYGNGYWEKDVFCRQGTGVLVWSHWRF